MINQYVYKIELNNGNLLLYNALTKAMIEVENSFDPNALTTNHKEYLKNNYFLVDDHKDGIYLKNEFELKTKYTNDVLSFVIHTNYSCNLSCTYCYQNPIKNNMTIDDKTVDEILNFIIYKCKIEKPVILDICFIGGEPLLMYDKIEFLLKNLDKKLAIFKRYSIITNGVFLSLEKYEKLVDLGIKGFQITLDGYRETHNMKRKSKNGEGSFDKIVCNIEKICKKYPQNNIIINYNLDTDTFRSVERFFEFLKDKDINCKVIFSEVFDTKDVSSGKEVTAEEKIWYRAHKIAIDYGQRYDPFYRMSYLTCGLKKNNNFIISPSGEVYKCISGIEDKKYRIGHIKECDSYGFFKNTARFTEMNVNEKCHKCKYYPVCGGGCTYRNTEKGFKCYKNEIEYNDIPLIKYQYEVENGYI